MIRTASKRLATGVVAAAIVSSGFAVSSAAAAEGPLTVQSVQAINDGGGLDQGWLPINCSVEVDFTDGTLAATNSAYVLHVQDAYGSDSAYAETPYALGSDPGALTFTVPCDTFYQDEASTVTVVEQDDAGNTVETSNAVPFTFSYTDHPAGINDTSVMKNGNWTNFVGKKASIYFDGNWESGTRFSTRIWTSKTKTFTGQDYTDNMTGGAAIVDKRDQAAPTLSYTPRQRDVGRWVWISIIGQVPGKGAWRFTFAPEYVAPSAQPRSAWYKSYGVRKGIAKVNRTVKMTAPVFTTAGKAAHIKTTYRWYQNGHAIPRATHSYYKIPRKYKGHKLTVKAKFSAQGYYNVTKTWSFGKVRR